MDAPTRLLVLALVRHAKGMLSAVERWVDETDDLERSSRVESERIHSVGSPDSPAVRSAAASFQPPHDDRH